MGAEIQRMSSRDSAYGDEPAYNLDDIDRVLEEIGKLRETVVRAWQERGLTLHREERRRLRHEIRSTCEMLTNLTASE